MTATNLETIGKCLQDLYIPHKCVHRNGWPAPGASIDLGLFFTVLVVILVFIF